MRAQRSFASFLLISVTPRQKRHTMAFLPSSPFRYRGYYFDTTTGLYYLHSRFYDPVTGRFLSPDSVEYLDPETINGLNLYAYCGNNPIAFVDPSGHAVVSIGAIIVGAIIGACIGFGTAAYVDYSDDGEIFNGSVRCNHYNRPINGGLSWIIRSAIALLFLFIWFLFLTQGRRRFSSYEYFYITITPVDSSKMLCNLYAAVFSNAL